MRTQGENAAAAHYLTMFQEALKYEAEEMRERRGNKKKEAEPSKMEGLMMDTLKKNLRVNAKCICDAPLPVA
jgi:hypothetical protein